MRTGVICSNDPEFPRTPRLYFVAGFFTWGRDSAKASRHYPSRKRQSRKRRTAGLACHVAATLTPSSDSEIRIEVLMPITNWNGKFQAVGNGGWSGSINENGMTAAVRKGYASASTDTGHSGGSASFALGHPAKLIDYAWRSEHEMTVKAKAIIAAFYGNGPKLSYWNGCSAGGKQALKEAQKFPKISTASSPARLATTGLVAQSNPCGSHRLCTRTRKATSRRRNTR